MKYPKIESPMKKFTVLIFDEKEKGKMTNLQGHDVRCPGCKERMTDFNTRTGAFECKCGLNWKLTLSPAGKKSAIKTTIKRRKK